MPIDQRQRGVMERAAELGLRFKQEYPEIFEMLRDNTMSHEAIAERVAPRIDDRDSLDTIVRAIEFGARGNPYTELRTPPYEGALTKEEADAIFRERRSYVGRVCREQGKGIHRLTEEQLIAHGKEIHHRRIGIHRRKPGDRQAAGRLGGRQSAINTGKHIWYESDPLEEGRPLRYAFELADTPGYFFQGEKQRRIHAHRIAEELTKRFPEQPPFTAHQVTSAFREHADAYERFVNADLYDRLPKQA